MKFKYKKYLYLINDVTNVLLQKELEKRDEEAINRLKRIITILSILLAVSVLLNLFLFFK